ncbi:MAG: hypothetical protein ABR523_08655 [Desulfurivibrionaceae bacterium]
MLLLRSVKIILMGFAVLHSIIIPGQYSAKAADEAESALAYDELITNSEVARRSASRNEGEDISALLDRIDALEQQLKYMQKEIRVMDKQLGASRTLANMINEGRSLASDAWNIAVEARAIAVRAEKKADQAGRSAE